MNKKQVTFWPELCLYKSQEGRPDMDYKRPTKEQQNPFCRWVGAQVIPFRQRRSRRGAEVVFIPIVGTEKLLATSAYLACLADQSIEGKKIVEHARRIVGCIGIPSNAKLISFTATSFTSGIEFEGRVLRKGTLFGLEKWLEDTGIQVQNRVRILVDEISGRGEKAFVLAYDTQIIGVIGVRR